MTKITRYLKKREKGQVLVILALLFIGLIAIIGLAVDMGYMYVSYSRLNRAVDGAALNATSQFKEGYKIADLEKAAEEFLVLNGVTNPVTVSIKTCDTADANELAKMKCDSFVGMKRKLAYVSVIEDVPTYFLSVLGIKKMTISAESVSEAASVDVVLVIDTSDSMTYGDSSNVVSNDMKDAHKCNNIDPTGTDGQPGECHPFEEVKDAAYQFVDLSMYDGYDRVAIVTFDKRAVLRLPLTSDKATVKAKIKELAVYEGGREPTISSECSWTVESPATASLGLGEPCRLYHDNDEYYGFDCYDFPIGAASGNPSRCTTTNIGGGLRLAGNEFVGHPSFTPAVPKREEALWVVILLTDGAANAGENSAGIPFCPTYTWDRNPYCRDTDATVRHCADDAATCAPGAIRDSSLYDADDFARDMADFVASGQNAVIFSIGLGNLVTSTTYGSPAAGESMMQYAALGANPDNKGEYYFAPTGSQLRQIFIAIANRIATRLTR